MRVFLGDTILHMPVRRTPLVNNEYYHVYNRTQNKIPFFLGKKESQRIMTAAEYYSFINVPCRLSYFLSYGPEKRREILFTLKESNKKHLEIYAFCIMPNHYHFLVQQLLQDGITDYFRKFQSSLSHYLNTRKKKEGHLFQSRFKSVRVEDGGQFLHLSRYIHLNPYSSGIVSDIEKLKDYKFSSLGQYLGLDKGFVDTTKILDMISGQEVYEKFVFDRANYQKQLSIIKHLTCE